MPLSSFAKKGNFKNKELKSIRTELFRFEGGSETFRTWNTVFS